MWSWHCFLWTHIAYFTRFTSPCWSSNTTKIRTLIENRWAPTQAHEIFAQTGPKDGNGIKCAVSSSVGKTRLIFPWRGNRPRATRPVINGENDRVALIRARTESQVLPHLKSSTKSKIRKRFQHNSSIQSASYPASHRNRRHANTVILRLNNTETKRNILNFPQAEQETSVHIVLYLTESSFSIAFKYFCVSFFIKVHIFTLRYHHFDQGRKRGLSCFTKIATQTPRAPPNELSQLYMYKNTEWLDFCSRFSSRANIQRS